MLKLLAVSKNFGGLQVLQNVSLAIPARGIYGLIGPNGAGKTTVFNLVTGVLALSAGTVEFFGERLNGLPPHQIARRGIARTFQNIRIFKEMTLIENVAVAIAGRPRYSVLSALLPSARYREGERIEIERAHELLARVGLEEKARHLAGSLSYGEQRRLEIARALATEPRFLLLDEPAAGMNSAEKQRIMEEIVKLDENGISVLLIEHDMRFVMELCRDITVLNFGSVIARGTPDEVRAKTEVIEAYLGTET